LGIQIHVAGLNWDSEWIGTSAIPCGPTTRPRSNIWSRSVRRL